MFPPSKALPVERKDYRLRTILFRAPWLMFAALGILFLIFKVLLTPESIVILCPHITP